MSGTILLLLLSRAPIKKGMYLLLEEEEDKFILYHGQDVTFFCFLYQSTVNSGIHTSSSLRTSGHG